MDLVEKAIEEVKRGSLDEYRHIVALLLLTSAFTVMKIWTLKDSSNNIILRYQEYNGENPEPPDISDDLELQKLYENLEPGKSLVYYDARRQKPDSKYLSMYSKPVRYTDLDVIREKAGFDFAVPSNIPEGYTFSEGKLTYEPLDTNPEIFEELINKLKEEAGKNGKNTAAIEWETSSDAAGIHLLYKNNEKEFIVKIVV